MKISKRLLLKIGIILGLLICTLAVLNIQVSTRQGINYEWYTIKIPLYLKILNFFDRHYNYKWLVTRIIKDTDREEEKVMDLFVWTHKNIRKPPKGLPLIDDHVWHIIVRGYGAGDQSSDVFTTLCNYAGSEAFFAKVHTSDRKKKIPLSFVKIEKKWTVFDPYYGIYFQDKQGNLASIEQIKSGKARYTQSLGKRPDFDYSPFLDNLPLVENAGFRRANIQSPLRRLLYEVNSWVEKIKGSS